MSVAVTTALCHCVVHGVAVFMMFVVVHAFDAQHSIFAQPDVQLFRFVVTHVQLHLK